MKNKVKSYVKNSLKAIILSSLILQSAFANERKAGDFDVELGAGLGLSNYSIDTFAHSILEWRDMNSIEVILGGKYFLTNKASFFADLMLSSILKGEMTDDDLQNSKCTKESSKCHAAFNINRKMKGNEFKVDLGFKYAFLQSNDNQLSFIAGGRYAMYTYSPSDMRQIEYIKSRGIEIALYQKSLDAFQETAPKYYGLVLGLEYEKLLPTQTFAIAVKGFLPLDFRSKQDWSSYEWSVEQKSIFSNAFGFDVKMSTALKVSDTNWINFYTSLNYFIAKNLAEYNNRDGFSKYVSKVKHLKHVRLSAGVSFLFKSN